MTEVLERLDAEMDATCLSEQVVERFGSRVRPSRTTPRSWVLDEVGELVIGAVGGKPGLLLRLPGGSVLNRVSGVDFTDLSDDSSRERAFDVLDRWASELADPRWSARRAIQIDKVAKYLWSRRVLSGFDKVTVPPIARSGQAYEALAVEISESSADPGDDESVTIRMRGPQWRPEVAGHEESHQFSTRGLSPSEARAQLTEVLDESAARLLPAGYLQEYDAAYRRAKEPGGYRGGWGDIQNRSTALTGFTFASVDELTAIVTRYFGPRATFEATTLIEATEWTNVRWKIDDALTLEIGFSAEAWGFGAGIELPNGAKTRTIFGERVLLGKDEAEVIAALRRVDRFVRLLLGEEAP